jgi:GT2 family glycosyltransferase
MLDEIGWFDEDFFLYCEDTDLGLRARWAGWRCVYAPQAVVVHRYSGTAGASSKLKAGFVERNRLWAAIKSFPLPLLLLVPLASLARYLWQVVAIRRNRGLAAAFVKSGYSVSDAFAIVVQAHWETLVELPRLLQKRAACVRRRKIPAAQFRRLLRQHSISLRDLAFAGS